MSSFRISSCIRSCIDALVSLWTNSSCCECFETKTPSERMVFCVRLFQIYIYICWIPFKLYQLCFPIQQNKLEWNSMDIRMGDLFCRKKGKENPNSCLICHCCCKKCTYNHKIEKKVQLKDSTVPVQKKARFLNGWLCFCFCQFMTETEYVLFGLSRKVKNILNLIGCHLLSSLLLSFVL